MVGALWAVAEHSSRACWHCSRVLPMSSLWMTISSRGSFQRPWAASISDTVSLCNLKTSQKQNCLKYAYSISVTKNITCRCCQVSPNCTVNVTEFDCLAGLAQWVRIPSCNLDTVPVLTCLDRVHPWPWVHHNTQTHTAASLVCMFICIICSLAS